jgi:hypothetical protein
MDRQHSTQEKVFWIFVAGIGGVLFISSLYFGLVSWAESLAHALDLFWTERIIVIPLFLGFGLQTSLYTVLKKRWFIPMGGSTSSGMITGTSGTTSTIAMVACCAHHVTDLLPILGISAAAAFLARYQTVLMLVGLFTTYLGVSIMVYFIFKERRISRNLVQVRAEVV